MEKNELLEREREFRSQTETTSRIRDERVATVSHDLKNSLTSILISAQLMEAGSNVDEQSKKQLELIRRSVKRMQKLIQDLLDTNKTESNKSEVGRLDFIENQPPPNTLFNVR